MVVIAGVWEVLNQFRPTSASLTGTNRLLSPLAMQSFWSLSCVLEILGKIPSNVLLSKTLVPPSQVLHFLLKHRRWVSLPVMEFTIILIYRLKNKKQKPRDSERLSYFTGSNSWRTEWGFEPGSIWLQSLWCSAYFTSLTQLALSPVSLFSQPRGSVLHFVGTIGHPFEWSHCKNAMLDSSWCSGHSIGRSRLPFTDIDRHSIEILSPPQP